MSGVRDLSTAYDNGVHGQDFDGGPSEIDQWGKKTTLDFLPVPVCDTMGLQLAYGQVHGQEQERLDKQH